MVRVTGLDAVPLPPPLLPQAAASRAATAAAAASLNRLMATPFRSMSSSLLSTSSPRPPLAAASRSPHDRLDELPVRRRGSPQEIQVASVGRLQHMAGVQGRPAAQVLRGR